MNGFRRERLNNTCSYLVTLCFLFKELLLNTTEKFCYYPKLSQRYTLCIFRGKNLGNDKKYMQLTRIQATIIK